MLWLPVWGQLQLLWVYVLAQFMSWQTSKGDISLVDDALPLEDISGTSVFQFTFHHRLTKILFQTNYVGTEEVLKLNIYEAFLLEICD